MIHSWGWSHTRNNTSWRIWRRTRRRLLASSMSSFLGSVCLAGSKPRRERSESSDRLRRRKITSNTTFFTVYDKSHSMEASASRISNRMHCARNSDASEWYLMFNETTIHTYKIPYCPYLYYEGNQLFALTHPLVLCHYELKMSSDPKTVYNYTWDGMIDTTVEWSPLSVEGLLACHGGTSSLNNPTINTSIIHYG